MQSNGGAAPVATGMQSNGGAPPFTAGAPSTGAVTSNSSDSSGGCNVGFGDPSGAAFAGVAIAVAAGLARRRRRRAG
jgi:MYXO-CTERM domain-containing protein